MRPPSGFGLESAMAVSFTLDLRALLAAPAAFRSRSARDWRRGRGQSGWAAIRACRVAACAARELRQDHDLQPSRGDRVAPFAPRVRLSGASGRTGPSSTSRCGAPQGLGPALQAHGRGDGEAESRMRVLVGSRNLTFDESWDTIVRLDEAVGGRAADVAPLADLFTDSLTRVFVRLGRSTGTAFPRCAGPRFDSIRNAAWSESTSGCTS